MRPARSATQLPHHHASHRTPLLRQLKGVDMWLQHNKVESLKVAASCIDGLLLRPGETFSFWRLVGKPSARRGFKTGMVLRNGTVAQGMGGGLCQMTNLIYWMALHTELSITERWRHGFDVFPDEGRSQPFASGATCSYNYIDLQISNRTQTPISCGCGWKAIICMASGGPSAPRYTYKVVERDHAIRTEWWGGYSRHNSLHRIVRDMRDRHRTRGRIHHREPCHHDVRAAFGKSGTFTHEHRFRYRKCPAALGSALSLHPVFRERRGDGMVPRPCLQP